MLINFYNHYLRKGLLAFSIVTVITSCTKEDDTPIEPANNAPTVTLTNIVSNDNTDTVTGKFTATDSDGTISQQTLQAEATDGSRVNITINADGTFSKTFTGTGKTFDTLIASAKDNDNATDETFSNLTPTITVEAPNTAPTITVTLNNIDENTPIGTVVGSIAANDADGDTLTYTITAGDDKFELDGTDIKTKVAFDFEDGNNAHDITVQANDGTDTTDGMATTTETDVDEVLNFVDRPDVTYTKTPGVGGGTVTEDLSHIDAADTKNAERVVDLADNDPNNQTLQNQLRVADNGGNEVWVDQQTRVNEINNSALETGGLGDDIENSYSNDTLGISGFSLGTAADAAANTGVKLKNQQNELVNGVGFRKSLETIKTSWNADNNMFFNAPNSYTGSQLRDARQVRAWLTDFGKNMQLSGANVEANILELAAESKAKIEAMTDAEMRDYMLTIYSDATLQIVWD